MPFFYSQSLTKDKKVKADPHRGPLGGGSRTSSTTHTAASSGRLPSSNTARRNSLTRGSSGRLVWHSQTGSSGKRNPKELKYSAKGKKVVHFSTIEVQPFHFDWNLANDVFYTRKELTAMGQSRFDDAATLRQQRRQAENENAGQAVDDVDISKRSKVKDIATLLSAALDEADRDENVSIRGIEHFVYPDLQQEMIRRKKEVKREVMGFVRSKRPDPQGWRLAQHSRSFSQWARNVALEKGMKYCMNNAAGDPEMVLSQDELERFQKSQDDLDDDAHCLRGSSSFSARGSSSFDAEPRSFDQENSPSLNILREIGEDDGKGGNLKEGDPDESLESQPAGVGTGED